MNQQIKSEIIFAIFKNAFLGGKFQSMHNCSKIVLPSFAAEEGKDEKEIRQLLESYVKAVAAHDIDSAMSYISTNYSDPDDPNIKDYASFRLGLEKDMGFISKRFVGLSVPEIQINGLRTQDNKTIFEVEFTDSLFNLDTLKTQSWKRRRDVSLAKDDGIWKITRWRLLKDF